MQEERDRMTWRRIVICVLVSLSLHAAGAVLLLTLSKPEKRPRPPKAVTQVVHLHRAAPPKKDATPTPFEKEPEKQTPFAKTNPDQREQLPERKDYIGKRNSRAASDADSKDLVSDEDAPAMTGEKKDELVTFRQERQDGDLQADGKREETPTPPPPAPAANNGTPTPAPEICEETQDEAADSAEPSRSETASTTPAPSTEADALNPGETTEAQDTTTTPTLDSLGIPIGEVGVELPPEACATAPTKTTPTIYRDPTLADHAQPGFRTNERRSRSSGRFVLGRNASLNVSATPLGRYQEEIYRRIAYWWYRACDEHRGDIIPGKIVVSIRLNNKGRLVNMDLIQRSGASVIQQSFTFGAIRNSTLPPMPGNVQAEMVGDLLELIFEFNFN